MYKFRLKIKSIIKTSTFFLSVVFLIIGGILSLSPITHAQTGSTFWNVERDASNNLNFYLTNNGTNTASGFTLNSTGVATARQGLTTGYAGADSGMTGDRPYQWGYQESGPWSGTFPDLVLGYHTGTKFGSYWGYGGMKFYNDHPSRTTTQLFSVGDGDQNVRVANWLNFPNGGTNSGISSPTNSAYLYPNDGTYGAWKITGNRNGWGGIEFAAPYNSAQGITLMVGHTTQNNSNIYTGFHQNGVGWLWYGAGGSLYASSFVDKDNGAYYLDPASSSNLNIAQFAQAFRTYGFNGAEADVNNGGYYVDPNGTTNLYAGYRYYGFNGPEYDVNNGGYYMDLNGNSRISNAYFDSALINWPGYNGITQAYGNYLWPGRLDGSGANFQQSWYLASHSSYGLYTNTGMFFNGGIYAPIMYDTANAGYYSDPGGQSRQNNIWLDYMSCMSSWCPQNYVMRLTPNLHMNSVAGYAMYVNWDNGYNPGLNFVVGNGAGGYALTVNGTGAFRSYGQTQRFDGQVGIWGYDPGQCGGGFGLCVGGASGGQSNWNNTSDVRLKENIVPIDHALNKIDALTGVYFNFKKYEDGAYKNLPKGKQIGFIAQEVEKVLPEVVITGEDGMKMMSYGNVSALLAEGIKAQQQQVKKLEEQNAQSAKVNEQQQTEIEQLKQQIIELKRAISERK